MRGLKTQRLQLPSIDGGSSSTSKTWGKPCSGEKYPLNMVETYNSNKYYKYIFIFPFLAIHTYCSMKIWHNNNDEFSIFKQGKTLKARKSLFPSHSPPFQGLDWGNFPAREPFSQWIWQKLAFQSLLSCSQLYLCMKEASSGWC